METSNDRKLSPEILEILQAGENIREKNVGTGKTVGSIRLSLDDLLTYQSLLSVLSLEEILIVIEAQKNPPLDGQFKE